ncbi:hypothetical protein HY993_02945 [Candidatus Micrarchaeota archaeon]|nr:hypothetical protein [Candidatus Micrarchaeota archaeon]
MADLIAIGLVLAFVFILYHEWKKFFPDVKPMHKRTFYYPAKEDYKTDNKLFRNFKWD